jgi:hypothetical protein
MLKKLGTSYEELAAESPSRFIENARGQSTPTQRLGSACFRGGHISAIKAQAQRIKLASASISFWSACLKANIFG